MAKRSTSSKPLAKPPAKRGKPAPQPSTMAAAMLADAYGAAGTVDQAGMSSALPGPNPRNMDKFTIATPDFSYRVRMQRVNPMPMFNDRSLARALSAWEYGDLRELAWFMTAIAKYDDTIPNVKGKREKDTAHRAWEVVITWPDQDDADAKRQQAVLQPFWSQATCVNAFDRNERGQMPRLIKQMMAAVSYKYAAHHIVWKPAPGNLTAVFEYIPPAFFENRTGELRFIPNATGVEGDPMPPENWMVTCGDGLMIPCTIAHLFKRLSYQDWIAFSEKFGTPGILGKTRSGADGEAGRSMIEAVQSFSADWTAVLFGDEGAGSIELIEAKGGAGDLPFPALVDRIDQKVTSMYRGANLSTQSEAHDTGASLQSDENLILAIDDAATISEAMSQVELTVLRWYFGMGVIPKAGIKLMVPDEEDLKLLLMAIQVLVSMGAPVEIADVLTRFGLPMPRDGAKLLKAPAVTQAPTPDMEKTKAGNDRSSFLVPGAPFKELLARASVEDRRGLATQLKSALGLKGVAQKNALTKIVAELPGMLGKEPAGVEAWERGLFAAFVEGYEHP